MLIRHSRLEDLAAIEEIYAHARAFMIASGNPTQWGDSWPPAEAVRGDIDGETADCGYVCEHEGRVVGVFFFAVGDDPTYEVIDGAWLDDSPYGVVHRIATDGTVKGTGSFCLQWACDQHPHQRIDTHPDNAPMRHVLEKLGFVECGTIYVDAHEKHSPRVAYEHV